MNDGEFLTEPATFEYVERPTAEGTPAGPRLRELAAYTLCQVPVVHQQGGHPEHRGDLHRWPHRSASARGGVAARHRTRKPVRSSGRTQRCGRPAHRRRLTSGPREPPIPFLPITFTGPARTPLSPGGLPALLLALARVVRTPSNEHAHHATDLSASNSPATPTIPAISCRPYRGVSRTEQADLDQLKDDMRIYAMGIRFLRTYNVQLPHAGNVVKAVAGGRGRSPASRCT